MAVQGIIFKVYLLNNDSSTKEIRKFNLTSLGAKDFATFNNKVMEIFPELKDKQFNISYKDFAQDEILVSRSEELQLALAELPRPAQFYVKLTSKAEKHSCSKEQEASASMEYVKHEGVVCDGCDIDITGFRYKCIQCDDYDLCSQCEATGLHSQHCFVRIPRPLHWHEIRGLCHNLKKIFKKNFAHSCRRRSSDEPIHRGGRCAIPTWLEAFPDLDTILDAIFEARISEPEPPKQSEKRNTSETPENEKKEASTNENTDTNDIGMKISPGEEKKLFDDAASVASVASVASQDSPVTKLAADEWTIVDKDDTVETNPAPSAPPNADKTDVSPSSSAAPSVPETNSVKPPLYPQLPEEQNVVHHPNPVINKAVETMIEMGFSNQNKLLTYLLAFENGDINRVLEILQPTEK